MLTPGSQEQEHKSTITSRSTGETQLKPRVSEDLHSLPDQRLGRSLPGQSWLWTLSAKQNTKRYSLLWGLLHTVCLTQAQSKGVRIGFDIQRLRESTVQPKEEHKHKQATTQVGLRWTRVSCLKATSNTWAAVVRPIPGLRLIGQITFHQNTRRYSLLVLFTLLGNLCQYF